MPITREIQVFQFDELSEDAKQRAREWYREASADDSFWSENVIEDAATVLERMGFDVRQRPVRLIGGGTRYEPAIYFSGFWSQGDGACFEGSWSPSSIMPREQFVAEYPAEWTNEDRTTGRSEQNAELHRIHAESVRLASLDPLNGIGWRCSHTGRYNHENSVTFDHWDERSHDSCGSEDCGGFYGDCRCACDACTLAPLEDIEDEHEENARDAMRWIYRQLEQEYEWQNADEQVDENIRANGYEFDEDGKRI